MTQLIRSLSILFLAFGHQQALWPILAPASLAVFIVCHIDKFRIYRRPPLTLLAAGGFILYFGLLLVVHGLLRDYSIVDIFRTSGRLAYMLGILVVICHLKPEVQIERPLFRSGMLCITIISVLSIYSCYVSQLTIADRPLNTDRALTGFFENHNTMAGAVGAVVIMGAVTLIQRMQGWGPKIAGPLTAPLTMFLALSFALCLSRSYSLGMVAAGAVIASTIPLRHVRRNIYLAGSILAVLLAVFVVVNRSRDVDSENISSRATLYRRAVGEILKSPLIGIGPGAFQELSGSQNVVIPGVVTLRRTGHAAEEGTTLDVFGAGGAHVHNTYLQILCDYGLIGAALLALMVYPVFSMRARVLHELREGDEPSELLETAEWNAKVVVGSLVFLCVSGATVNWCFSSPPYTLFAYVAMGRFAAICDALAIRASDRETELDHAEMPFLPSSEARFG